MLRNLVQNNPMVAGGLLQGWVRDPRYRAIDAADGAQRMAAGIADFRRRLFALPAMPSDSIGAAATTALVPVGCRFSDWFTFTRSGSATYIDASGAIKTAATDEARFDWTNGYPQLLLEGSATNLFLNSATGATQSFTVTAQAYTVSFYGTGSITLSGTSSGTISGTGANVRTTYTFTPTAGTLTMTVSGTITSVQFQTGSFASSYIATTGSAASRAADVCQLSAKALAILARSAAGVVIKGQGINGPASTARILLGGASGSYVMRVGSAGVSLFLGSATTISQTVTSPLPAFGAAGGWDAAGKALSYNGATIATDSTALDTTLSSAYLGSNVGSNFFANGWYDEIVIFPFKPTNIALVEKARAYA